MRLTLREDVYPLGRIQILHDTAPTTVIAAREAAVIGSN